MSEETANTVAEVNVPEKVEERKPKRRSGNTLWWGILSVYLSLFMATGYIAFIMKDRNPALDPSSDQTVARLTDDTTREFMLKTLEQEAEDHKKKAELGAQSFNVVLGALLGFLSASAVARTSTGRKNEN